MVGLKKDQLFLNGKAASSKTEVRSNLEAAGFSCSNPYYIVRQGQINKVNICMLNSKSDVVSKVACCSSEARLTLVKEVAGLGIYQEKRTKSEEELHKTEIEIRETEVSLGHVQERLEQLNEEKQALEELKKVEREKKAVEAVMLEAELKESKEKLKRGEKALVEVESTEKKKKLAEVVASGTQKREALKTLKAKADVLELEQSSQCQEAEKLEKRKEALRLKKVDLEEEIEATQVSSGGGGKLERLELKSREMEKNALEVSTEVEEREARLSEVTKEREGIYSRLGRSRQFRSVEARDKWIEEEVEKIRQGIHEKEGIEQELQALVDERKQKLRKVEAYEESREAKEQRLRDGAHGQLIQMTKERAEHRRRIHEICNQAIQLQHQHQAEEEISRSFQNRLRMMPGMKQVLQGLDTINKVLEEVPHLKTGYHGLVIVFTYYLNVLIDGYWLQQRL